MAPPNFALGRDTQQALMIVERLLNRDLETLRTRYDRQSQKWRDADVTVGAWLETVECLKEMTWRLSTQRRVRDGFRD